MGQGCRCFTSGAPLAAEHWLGKQMWLQSDQRGTCFCSWRLFEVKRLGATCAPFGLQLRWHLVKLELISERPASAFGLLVASDFNLCARTS